MFLGNIDSNRHINIIGAGFSGLILGHFLKKHGYSFTIFEQHSLPGGMIATDQHPTGNGETGAHAFFANDSIIKEFESLGLKPIHSQSRLAKKVYRRGKISNKFVTPLELLKIVVNIFLKRPPKVTDDTSVADFLLPLTGQSLISEALNASMQGIYAADLYELNLKSIFKQVKWNQVDSYFSFIREMKKNSRKGFRSISFENGMKELIDELANELAEHITYSEKIDTLPDNCIICTNAKIAAELLENSHPSLSHQLNRITYPSVTGATLITEEKIPELENAFGALFPRDNIKSPLLGILNNYAIFPQQRKKASAQSYTFIVKTSEQIESTIQVCLEELGLSQIWNKRMHFHAKPWKEGLPLYNNERFQAVEEIRKDASQGVALFGNYINGISLREIYFEAQDFAVTNLSIK